MKEFTLKNLPKGATARISRCLSPARADVYRLLELGLYRGATFTIVRETSSFGALELALGQSRLCIADDLANEFLAVPHVDRARG